MTRSAHWKKGTHKRFLPVGVRWPGDKWWSDDDGGRCIKLIGGPSVWPWPLFIPYKWIMKGSVSSGSHKKLIIVWRTTCNPIMSSRGGDMGSLLIFRATGEGDRGALGGRCWPPGFPGTVKWDSELEKRTKQHLVSNTRHFIHAGERHSLPKM